MCLIRKDPFDTSVLYIRENNNYFMECILYCAVYVDFIKYCNNKSNI